ncbi:MAG: hypothetical protein ACRDSK_05890 [Actinophytocola sp.]|uniref:hypothetical protein n=1 Tax=Actinophytocola sp. TaxID=1872138 RepID=UPI003D6AAF2F
MTSRLLVAVLCAGLFLAGCTSSANDRPNKETTATEHAAPVTVRPECVDVADKANEFLSRVVRLADGDSTARQLRAAADGLSDSFDEVKAAVGPDAAADLDEAGQALARARDALAARPVDTAGLRTAANDLLTSLGDAAAVCTPDSTTTSTEDPTGTGTTPAPSTNPDLSTPTLDPTY